MADLKTSLILTLKDRLTAPAKRIKQSLNGIADAARLKGRLRLLRRQGNQLRQNFKGLTAEGKILAKRMTIMGGGAAFLTAGLFRLANGSARVGDAIAKTARKLGLGVEELQKWRFAADRSGIASNTFDMALQRFTRRAREAADGTGEARGALQFLGIELKDGEGNLRSRTELLDDIGEAMKNIEDPSLRMRVAFKLFDSEGVSMVNMLTQGKEGMQQLRKEAEELGLITEENAARSEAYVDQLTNFMQVIKSLKDSVIGELLPGMTAWLKTQTELIKSGKQNFLGELVNNIRSGTRAVLNFVKIANRFAESMGGWKNILTAIVALMGVKFIASLILTVGTLTKIAVTAIPLVIAGFKALMAVMLANPIIAVVAGIALAATLIIRNWTPIKGFFKNLWGEVKALFKDGFLKGMVGLILKFNPIALFARVFNGLLEYFTGFSLADAGAALMNSWRAGMEAAWGGVVSWFRGQLSGFLNLIPSGLRERLGFGNIAANITSNNSSPSAVNLPQQQVAAEVGGTLKIQIDSEGRPKIARMEKRGGMDIETTTGMMMVGAG